MGRTSSIDKNGLKKGPWTAEEDQKLLNCILKHGHGKWKTVPKNAGLERCGKSCRLRWTNYLRPDIKRGKFTFEEEETIIQLHSILGNKWSAIAARLPGRTDNEIKNYWNTHIRKRLLRMGIDPVTHTPRLDLLQLYSILNSSLSNSSQLNSFQNLTRLQPSSMNSNLLNLATSLAPSDHLKTFQYWPIEPHAQNHLQQMFSLPVLGECSELRQANEGQDHAPSFTNFFQDSPPISYHQLPIMTQNSASGIEVTNNSNLSFIELLYGDQSLESIINNNCSFGSFVSLPSSKSTLLHSPTNFVSSGTEDEKESYPSNMLLELPKSLDMDSLSCR